MKAAQIAAYGDASVVQIVDVDKPVVAAGKVLVEVYASSINPFDLLVRSGAAQQMAPLTLPVTLGCDIAGVVSEVGEGVDGLAVGDKVYGQANPAAGASGAWSEFALTTADHVALAPTSVDFRQAAALPLVGVSALQALTEHLQVKSGQKAFINGGGGGIGSIAIQIAKHLGAYVAVTSTGEGLALATKLGADEVIDYKAQDFTTVLHDFDTAFDTVGGDGFDKAMSVVRDGGRAVSMVSAPDETVVAERHLMALRQQTQVTPDKLQQLAQLVDDGIVTPQVGQVFPLADITSAMQAKENGTIPGKIVIEIKGE